VVRGFLRSLFPLSRLDLVSVLWLGVSGLEGMVLAVWRVLAARLPLVVWRVSVVPLPSVAQLLVRLAGLVAGDVSGV
jgi:hypothetical protein